jgi:hypothetical protein
MRTSKINLTGIGTVAAATSAAMLILIAGTAFAGVKTSSSKPAASSSSSSASRPAGSTARPGSAATRPGAATARPGAAAPAAGRPGAATAVSAAGRPGGVPATGVAGRPGGAGSVARKPSPVSQHDPKGNFQSENVRGHVDPKTGKVTHMEKTNVDGSRLTVHNSPGGVRRVESVSRDPYGHSVRTVSNGHSGFRERDLLRRPGYRQRTYFDHGHVYARIYRDHLYARYGGVYPVYVPAYYYSPAYYAWYGEPWVLGFAFCWEFLSCYV